MSAGVLTLRDVVHRRDDRFELSIDDLSLGPGVTVVAGPNGSGKSTLLRLVATVERPGRGALHVGGRPALGEDLARVRRSIGMAPQEDSVPPRRRVFDHVDVVAVLREVAPDSPSRRRGLVVAALRDLDLLDVATRRAGELSGGARRRVALAAAWCGAPPLLVLDEPTTHLDADHANALARLLRGRSPRTAAVVATHDLAWGESIADRLVRLDRGRVVAVEARRPAG